MSDGTDTQSEQSPYLTKSTMLPIDGVIYCLEHTAVHDDTEDPYGYGEKDCDKKEHRAVYYRARKGDLDERIEEAIQYGKEQHGETHDATDLPEGSVVVDNLSGVQKRATNRIISAMAKAGLTAEERALLLRMVDNTRDTAESAVAALRQVFSGHDPDVGEVGKTLALLNSIHDKLTTTDDTHDATKDD